MKAHLGIGVVAAPGGAVILADVFDVPKYVTVLVLHHLLAEIGAKPHIADRDAFPVQPLDREILHHHQAATVDQLAADIGQHVGELVQREVLPANRRQRQPPLAEIGNRGEQLLLIPIGDPIGPILHRPKRLRLPRRRIDHRLHRDGRHALALMIGAEIRHRDVSVSRR